MHVIPVASDEIKKEYPNIFMGKFIFYIKKNFLFFRTVKRDKAIISHSKIKKNKKEVNHLIKDAILSLSSSLVVNHISLKELGSDNYSVKIVLSIMHGDDLKYTFSKLKILLEEKLRRDFAIYLLNLEIKIKKIMVKKRE